MIASEDRLLDQEQSGAGLISAGSGVSIKISPFLAREGFGNSSCFSFDMVVTDKSQSVAMANASSYVPPCVTGAAA